MKKISRLWRFLVCIGWAKTGLWHKTRGLEKELTIVSLYILERDDKRAVGFIFGPIIILIGLIT